MQQNEATDADVVIVGGGVNGLTCGCYLAKAGLRTVILEKRHVVGGGATTEEVTLPGFKHNLCSIMHWLMPPQIMFDDLDLNSHGLNYTAWDGDGQFPRIGTPYADGTGLLLWGDRQRTIEEIALLSEADARSYERLMGLIAGFRETFFRDQMRPPRRPSEIFAELEETKSGREVMRYMLMTTSDVLDEWFENDKVKGSLSALTAIGTVKPTDAGGGVLAYGLLAALHDWDWYLGVGGSQTISTALRNCFEAHGGIVETETEVSRIGVENGRATSVETTDGNAYGAAKAVVSTDPKKLFGSFLDADVVPAGVTEQMSRFRYGVRAMLVSYALEEAPVYRGFEDRGVDVPWILTGDTLKDVDENFRDAQSGRLTVELSRGGFMVGCPTLVDPTQAPEGKHTVYLYWFVPADGTGVRWDEIKEAHADHAEDEWRKIAPNMTKDKILARHVQSPNDIERRNGLHGPNGFNMAAFQQGWLRPTPEMSDYRTPIESLYLTGPGTWPGGDVRLTPGHNTAKELLADLEAGSYGGGRGAWKTNGGVSARVTAARS
ncbi:All-trans-zeta-carotene desaturase [Capillimicrobium parvum]|uniref:All-trans-zeta-carotene desaturase n=2 Tax=Capillimicrobium parvum TaxID=2884022 RepID=A0A9E7C037_9ACTN|nr:All-trans-zeta-carotene desaturase [Capillimicrobium parvum]